MTLIHSLYRLSLAGFAAISLSAQAALPDALNQPLRDAGISPDGVALWVAPASGGEPLIQHNAQQLMNPASVMKLITSYAALDMLGSAYTWKTRAWLGGELNNGRLTGNVLIAASGDPDMSWDRLGQWLRDWRARGLRDIQGDIVIDRSLLLPSTPASQFDDAPHRAYNALPDAFLTNFGALSVRLSPGLANGGVDVVSLNPAAPLRIQNRIRASNGPCVDWRSGLRGSFRAEGKGFMLSLEGKLPASCGEKIFNLAVGDSLRWTGAVIRAQWQELGGTWSGEVRSEALPAELPEPFSVWQSPTLPEVLRDMDKWSNNVMARMVFLSLGNDDSGTPLTAERSLARLLPWMTQQGLDATQWVFENGSGLSRSERTTTAQLGALLQAAWHSPRMPEFVAAQPVVGADGTMRSRLPNTPLAGRGYVKTGTLDGVKSAAGYLLDAQGQWKAFALIINHPKAGNGEPAVEALLQWLYAGR
ncbi:D-alanyl-D-alanine carboxypeptidase/D-alanyl-D-alanine endopeptidase [Uliginosibacterium gangwonense]|uniref:D-alanyl-D-alanine carboxypeptidase/D-alanyl-D-alanine endopeptidase n=1 Tax=Uliginosibacterium gangwonense TaxID=392736 RepID=UPI000366BA9F|nr:D-alanyl-D-alanine carboxypeptidase/D-alanyl-D-alanine-endopeptidase [Uliginosibacterium gangwonense]